jgi:hypothetical protein
LSESRHQATSLEWAEYFVRESGADKVEYFQREGPRSKQYAEIVAYLRTLVSKTAVTLSDCADSYS